jgi:hypothetical protein
MGADAPPSEEGRNEMFKTAQPSGALLLAYSQIISLENLWDGVLTVDPSRAMVMRLQALAISA